MNILVTGGAGFIGSQIVRQLIRSGYQPIVIDDLSNGHKKSVPKEVPLHIANVGDSLFLKNLFGNHKIEAVIHCAAFVNVNESVKHPSKYHQNNVNHSMTLLRACEAAHIRSFIFSSSAAVYGEPEKIPVRETAPTLPINPYGETKLVFEKMLHDSCAAPSSKMKYIVLRYFNVAGADTKGEVGQSNQKASHLIHIACQAASGRRDHIKIYGTDYPTPDGTCVRDFIHIEDLAITHVQAIEYLHNGGASEIFNCGYGDGFSVKEVLKTMKQISHVNFKIMESERRPGDPAQLIAHSGKIQKILGWSPKFNDLSLICETALKWEHKLQSEI